MNIPELIHQERSRWIKETGGEPPFLGLAIGEEDFRELVDYLGGYSFACDDQPSHAPGYFFKGYICGIPFRRCHLVKGAFVFCSSRETFETFQAQ